jgi:uncharacterized protein (TIGR04376 family)
MGLIEDISRFLETRLEEFIRNNPQVELQALEEKLRQQETEVVRLIADFRVQEKTLQDQILAIAEDIRIWHDRVLKAQQAGRQDLASGAQEREGALLRQGNQVWAQMELIKKRLSQTVELHGQIQERIKEVHVKIAQVPKTRPEPRFEFNWENLNPPPSPDSDDPLEAKFQKWEMDDELERLKRKIGR